MKFAKYCSMLRLESLSISWPQPPHMPIMRQHYFMGSLVSRSGRLSMNYAPQTRCHVCSAADFLPLDSFIAINWWASRRFPSDRIVQCWLGSPVCLTPCQSDRFHCKETRISTYLGCYFINEFIAIGIHNPWIHFNRNVYRAPYMGKHQ